MPLNVLGVVVNVAMGAILIVVVITGVMFRTTLTDCETKESKFCMQFTCPCNDEASGPCGLSAQRPGDKPGTYYCINAPLTLVDSSGKRISG